MKLLFNKTNWTDVTSKFRNLQYNTWYDCFKYNWIKFLPTSVHLAHYCLSNHSYLVQYFCFLFSIRNYKHLECLLYVDLWSLMQNFGEISCSLSLSLIKKRNMMLELLSAWIFSDANLQLLFTVVENASSETVRSNCTIALGDLAVRFPNLLEPWTENMYARLQDASVSVRKNAVLVLSHLILNDMMKVWETGLFLLVL